MVLEHEIIETDVLIIGAGAAGLRAAIEANNIEASVAIVSKGDLPSGCSAIAMGALQASCKENDSPNIHLRDTLMAGEWLNNQKLVRILVEEALERVQDLDSFGTKFLKEGNNYKLFPFPGCAYPRSILTYNPYQGGFIKGLAQEVKRRKINIFKNVAITNLLKKNGEIVGAIGLDFKLGIFVVFYSKSTVVATGGAGGLYSLTTNPSDNTGDGYALAYRAGAELMDMEFIQFRASCVHPEKLRGEPLPADGLVSVGGRFYNALCERYMKKYDPKNLEIVTRDLSAICAYKEIKAGKCTSHGGVYCDFSDVSIEEIERFDKFIGKCKQDGIDLRWQPMEWAPGAHYFMGGIRINEKCETNIPGLYAAGECTGGIHGANRLAANSLTDTQVFGARAGRFAAQKALPKPSPLHDKLWIGKEKKRVLKFLKNKKGINVLHARNAIQTIMDNSVGVVRNAEDLKKAISSLEVIKEKTFPRLSVKESNDYSNLVPALEFINLTETAYIVARAALQRRETRGAHYREDYPQKDDKNWLKNIIVVQKFGELKTFETPVVKDSSISNLCH